MQAAREMAFGQNLLLQPKFNGAGTACIGAPQLLFLALALQLSIERSPLLCLRGSKWFFTHMTHAQPHTFSRRILPKAAK
jgi:hypothetical protein